jgi:hypothetical protein
VGLDDWAPAAVCEFDAGGFQGQLNVGDGRAARRWSRSAMTAYLELTVLALAGLLSLALAERYLWRLYRKPIWNDSAPVP